MSPTGCTPHRHTVIVPPKDHSNTTNRRKKLLFQSANERKKKRKKNIAVPCFIAYFPSFRSEASTVPFSCSLSCCFSLENFFCVCSFGNVHLLSFEAGDGGSAVDWLAVFFLRVLCRRFCCSAVALLWLFWLLWHCFVAVAIADVGRCS